MKEPNELYKMTNQELISIYNTLNYWEWPNNLGDKPDGWDKMPNYKNAYTGNRKTKEEVIRPYMEIIYLRIGRKELRNQ